MASMLSKTPKDPALRNLHPTLLKVFDLFGLLVRQDVSNDIARLYTHFTGNSSGGLLVVTRDHPDINASFAKGMHYGCRLGAQWICSGSNCRQGVVFARCVSF